MWSGATGKPTKDVVKAEIITMLKEAGNTFAEDVLNDRTDCGVDGRQDKLSAETLQELADGNVGITLRNRSASRPGTEIGDIKAVGGVRASRSKVSRKRRSTARSRVRHDSPGMFRREPAFTAADGWDRNDPAGD